MSESNYKERKSKQEACWILKVLFNVPNNFIGTNNLLQTQNYWTRIARILVCLHFPQASSGRK